MQSLKNIKTYAGLIVMKHSLQIFRLFNPGYVFGTLYMMCSLDVKVALLIMKELGILRLHRPFDSSCKLFPPLGEVLIIQRQIQALSEQVCHCQCFEEKCDYTTHCHTTLLCLCFPDSHFTVVKVSKLLRLFHYFRLLVFSCYLWGFYIYLILKFAPSKILIPSLYVFSGSVFVIFLSYTYVFFFVCFI